MTSSASPSIQSMKASSRSLPVRPARTPRPVASNDVVTSRTRTESGRSGSKTFDQVLAPVWEGWQQSGMTEDEIDDMFAASFRRSGGNGGRQRGTT